MVIGLALYSWNYAQGIVLDVIYPNNLDLDENFVNKILMAHSLDDLNKNMDFIEMELEEKIIMSFWNMLPDGKRGYELLLLILQKEESKRKNYYKTKFLTFAKDILEIPQSDKRKELFLNYVQQLFYNTKKGKVLLLGRAATGKSSIKEVIFEGKEPSDLLNKSLTPTISLTPSVHSWLDLELGIFDTVGQKLDDYLEKGRTQIMAFSNATVIIYLIDYAMWLNNSDLILEDIKNISEILEKESYFSEFVLFLHKIDLIDEKNRAEKLHQIEIEIQEKTNLPLYFTSIHPKLLYSLYDAFCRVISHQSAQSSLLKESIDAKIKELPKTLCFITNEQNNIIVQSMTSDFDYRKINYMHNLIAQTNGVFESMKATEQIKYFLLSTFDNFTINMKNLGLSDQGLKNIVCISHLRPDQQIRIVDDLSDVIITKLKDL